jgi:predicted transposase YdaD
MLANREEVIDMSLYEYDEELHIRSEKEIAKQEGIEEGRAEERKKIFDALIHSLHNKGKTMAEISELLDLSLEVVAAILSEQE